MSLDSGSMTPPRLRWAAAGAAVVTAACAVATFWLAVRSPGMRDAVGDAATVPYLIGMTLLAATGALVVWHELRSTMGWLMVVTGGLGVLSRCSVAVAVVALDGGLPGVELWGWLTNWIWIPAQSAALVLLLRFPDGRLPGNRWRVIELAVAGWTAAAMLVTAVLPGPLGAEFLAPLTNPLGIASLATFLDGALDVLFILMPLLVLAAAIAPMARWPRAPADQRRQLRVVAVACLLVGVTAVLAIASDAGIILEGVAYLVLPLAVAYAVARHDLWGIGLRRRFDRLRGVREEERRRLQHDLHDSLGPTLGAIAMRAEAARNVLRTAPDAVDDLLVAIGRDAETAMIEVRRFVDELGPSALAETDLVTALREIADAYGSRGLAVRMDLEELDDLEPATEIAIYRVVAESVRNVARHARATSCTVALRRVEGVVELSIDDDGAGLGGQPEGVGRRAMRERIRALGGRLDVADQPDGGVRVAASLPMAS